MLPPDVLGGHDQILATSSSGVSSPLCGSVGAPAAAENGIKFLIRSMILFTMDCGGRVLDIPNTRCRHHQVMGGEQCVKAGFSG